MKILYYVIKVAMRLILNLIFALPEVFSWIEWQKRKGNT